jgi:hypothetical protein
VEFARRVLRGDAQFFVQQAHALVVLAQGRGLLTGQGVEAHEDAMGRFVEIVQGEQATGEGDGVVGFARLLVMGNQPFQRPGKDTPVFFGLKEAPVVEVRCVGQAETGEKVAPVVVGGSGQLCGIAAGIAAFHSGQKAVHIQPDVAREGDVLPIRVQPVAVTQRAFQAGEFPTQATAGVCALRPEERGQTVPALLLTGHGQVGEQGQTLLAGEGDDFPVDFDPGRAEEEKREWHRNAEVGMRNAK